MADRVVRAVFCCRRTRTLSGEMHLRIPAGGRGAAHAALITCNDYAWDNEYTHWAHYDHLTGADPCWRVFAVTGRATRILVTSAPTKEAAEMLMIHGQ